jgi:hypothetical protein
MTLVFQLPAAGGLRKAVRAASKLADSGGGIFAFATARGIDAFISDIAVLLKEGRKFRLVVGIDAITNNKALDALVIQRAKYPSLEVSVFYHEEEVTFHPKLAWFERGARVEVITGSGNLTERGLGQIMGSTVTGNWEAFLRETHSGVAARSTVALLNRWLKTEDAGGRLRDPDDPDVRARAMENARVRFVRTTSRSVRGKSSGTSPPIVDTLDKPEILVRELSSNRPGQADIGTGAFMNFFGYANGSKEVRLQYVDRDDDLGRVHRTPLVVAKVSGNYRIELDAFSAAHTVKGARDQRTILVAARFDSESFRYTLVGVSDPDYEALSRYLGRYTLRKGRHMRERLIENAAEFEVVWPAAPFHLKPINVPGMPI